MSDLRKIVLYLIGLVIVIRFFFIPVIKIFINLYKFLNIKKEISKFGKLIVKGNVNKSGEKKSIIFYCVVIVFAIIFGILLREPVFFIYIIIMSANFMNLALLYIFSKYNGIYENGIVSEKFYTWNDVFSWKIVNDDTFSFLKQNGMRSDIKVSDKIQDAEDFLNLIALKHEE